MKLFFRAARYNRQQEAIRRAVAVSLGIKDALGGGQLVPVWLEGCRETEPAAPPAPLRPEVRSWFQGLPVKGS